ncbi:MAG: hypothetical protein KKG75_02535 [Nanoarchaeota archaeon]|nr:hypothetical protein [Nanoarchaeota archaeon]
MKRSNPKKRICKSCGKALKGIKRMNAFSLRKINKSFKRVNRKYGGELCTTCSREKIIETVRK